MKFIAQFIAGLAGLGLIAAGFARAETVSFSDAHLEQAVRDWFTAHGTPLGATIDSGDLAGVGFTELEASKRGIERLDGLQYAVDLQKLNLNYNRIQDLGPVSALTQLTELKAGYNAISDLTPLQHLTGLTYLELGFGDPEGNELEDEFFAVLSGTGINQVTDLSPLAGLVNLAYLNVGGNAGIDSIEVLGTLEKLETFLLSGTSVSDFSPLANLTSLNVLILSANGMHDSDLAYVGGLTNLKGLVIAHEPNLTNMSALSALNPEMLFLFDLRVSDLSVMSGFSNLRQVMVWLCDITAFPDLSASSPDSMIILQNKLLTDISSLSALTSLTDLQISGSPVSDIRALAALTNLSSLNLNSNNISDIQPLLDNPGLGGNDLVSLFGNPLSGPAPSAACEQLPEFARRFDNPGNLEINGICGDTVSLTVIMDGLGMTMPEQGMTGYALGQTAMLIAVAPQNSGYSFAGWTGDLVSSDQFETIVMDGDKVVTAHFAAAGDYTLSISASGLGGEGLFSLPPQGNHRYATGQIAKVLGLNEENFAYFAGWTGDVVSSSPYIEIPMDSDKHIVGNMVSEGFLLEINFRGNGRTNFVPLAINKVEAQLASGLSFPISAIPSSPDWRFDHWEGDVGGNDPLDAIFDVVMDQDRTLTAIFSPVNKEYALVILDSQGGMPQNSQGLTNPPSGAFGYDSGEQVSIEAFPVAGWRFAAWDGDVPEEQHYDNPVTITMSQHRTIRPVFIAESAHTLSLSIAGNGDVAVTGGARTGPSTYAFWGGYDAELTIVCDADMALSGWSGDIDNPGSRDRRIYLDMDQDRSVTATFVPADYRLTLACTGVGKLDYPAGQYGFIAGGWVNLNASLVVNSGYAFQGWQGDAGTSSNFYFGFSMDSDKAVEAVFVTPGEYTLTISAPQGAGYGSCNPVPGSYAYFPGQEVFVQAYSNYESYFAGWHGGITDPNPNIRFVMDDDKVVYPIFLAEGYALELAITEGGWINDYGPGTQYFARGAAPTFVASPWYGYAFQEWQGDVPEGVDATNPQITIAMTENRRLTAVFTSTSYPLVLALQGAGTIDPAPGTYRYNMGTSVKLYATPVTGGRFIKWLGDIGDAPSWEPELTLTMDQARSVTAKFKAYDYDLTVNVSGVGNAAPEGTTSYFSGTVVDLLAWPQADSGYAFDRWSGSISSMDLAATVTMNGNRSVTAEFVTPGDFTLSVGAGGDAGSSSVDSGIGELSFMNGQEFTLTAQPAARHYFSHWEGDIDPAFAYSPAITVMMDQDRSVTAIFGAYAYRMLSVEVEGIGETSPPAGTYEYVDGNRVVVFAFDSLGTGYLFDHWAGDIGENDPYGSMVAFDIYEDRTVRAIFRQGDWNLNISARGGGEIYPPGGEHAYMDGGTARFEAIPYVGYRFAGWSGDIGGAIPQSRVLDLTMTQNRVVTAVFEPEASVFCHVLVPAATPYVSNSGIGYYTYDSFGGVTEEIVGVRFWGFTAHQGSSGYEACEREPDDFEVVICADNGHGAPGGVLYQEQFHDLTGQDTGQDFFDYDILDYAVTFAQPQRIESGWLSIRGVSDGNCWFLWGGSDGDDNECLQYNPDTGEYVPKGADSAFCLISYGAYDFHSADTTQDFVISLTELLRVIQFFNTQGYYCQGGTEDGYAPGTEGDRSCRPHDSDYSPQDWRINLTELLRLIQFFNSGGYSACPGEATEDGFCVASGKQ